MPTLFTRDGRQIVQARGSIEVATHLDEHRPIELSEDKQHITINPSVQQDKPYPHHSGPDYQIERYGEPVYIDDQGHAHLAGDLVVKYEHNGEQHTMPYPLEDPTFLSRRGAYIQLLTWIHHAQHDHEHNLLNNRTYQRVIERLTRIAHQNNLQSHIGTALSNDLT